MRLRNKVVAIIHLLTLLPAISSLTGPLRVEKANFHELHLPNQAVPKHYDLYLDLTGSESYTGIVRIDVDVGGSWTRKWISYLSYDINEIYLHADQSVNIYAVRIKEAIRPVYSILSRQIDSSVTKILRDNERQMIKLVLKQPLRPGFVGKIEIDFMGHYHNEELRGIYQKKYKYDGKEMRYVASSFEPINARVAFPCFDEPALKASFRLKIKHQEGENALSNWPVHRKKVTVTEFEQTDPISTHMLNFAIGKFISSRGCSGQSRFCYFSRLVGHHVHEKHFVNLIASAAMKYMSDIFGDEYVPRKFEIVSLPDRSKETSGSCGLSIIRSDQAFLDVKTDRIQKASVKFNVARVIARQFFGCSITSKWWDDMWIIEGTIAQLAFDFMRKNVQGAEYIELTFYLSPALEKDAQYGQTISPSWGEIGSLKIDSIYDKPRVVKSGSLIQRLKNAMGPNRFNKLLKLLIKKHKHGSFDQADLSIALKEVDERIISLDYIRSRIYDSGCPVLMLDITEDGRTLLLDRRFSDKLNSKVTIEISGLGFKQFVPVSTQTELFLPDWFDARNEKDNIKLIFEPDISSYFRIGYKERFIGRFLKKEVLSKMNPMEYFRLLDDSHALVKMGFITEETFLKLINYDQTELNDAVLTKMLDIGLSLKNDSLQHRIRKILTQRFRDSSEFFNWLLLPTNLPSDTALCDVVVNIFLKEKSENNIKSLLDFFMIQDSIRPHAQQAIFTVVSLKGNENHVEKLFSYLKSDYPSEKIRAINAIAKSSDRKVLISLQEWIKLEVKSSFPELSQQVRDSILSQIKIKLLRHLK